MFSLYVRPKMNILLSSFHCNFCSSVEILSSLLDYGADINQSGWLKINEDWWFGTPLELTMLMESNEDDVEEMKDLLTSANQSKWTKLEPTRES
jgi:hypothetical protein